MVDARYMAIPIESLGASYKYDPLSNLISSSGPGSSANLYRFSSKMCTGNSALYYYGYRFYNPSLQRWMNRDPIQETGGYNVYEFVGNNPIYKVDPLGRWWRTAYAQPKCVKIGPKNKNGVCPYDVWKGLHQTHGKQRLHRPVVGRRCRK